MSELDFKSNSYNYYPRTMIRLCEISYGDFGKIKDEVAALYYYKDDDPNRGKNPDYEEMRQEVVWGPAEASSSWGVTYSLMFVAYRPYRNEYTVVIRGTNPISWESWCDEDFAIGTTQAFNQLAPHAPANALVSQGTFNGMRALMDLTDPDTGSGMVTYLQGLSNNNLYVTGHSLGGTLTPPMFAYLNDVLYGGGFIHNMALWSFAGLTAGDAGFNTYFDGLLNPEFPFRLHNTLDVAPFCWWSQDSIERIYHPHRLNWGFPEDDFVKKLFKEAAGIGYAQPSGEQALPGEFDESIVDKYLWTAQAMHQHHSTTYQTLVDKTYPPYYPTE
jgi:hypothetical protein